MQRIANLHTVQIDFTSFLPKNLLFCRGYAVIRLTGKGKLFGKIFSITRTTILSKTLSKVMSKHYIIKNMDIRYILINLDKRHVIIYLSK